MIGERKIRVTALDIKALRAIKECGFIGVALDGEPWLQSSYSVGPGRLKRLVAQKLLKSNQDGLLPGIHIPQSYTLTKRGLEVCNA